MSEISDPNRPFSILVLNGGGIRGYTSLCVLEELEDEVKRALVRAGEADRYSESLKPCNIFNFIAGVSTGAIIAIMLGRLEMSIEECKVAYQQLSQKVFSDSTIRTTTRFFKTIIRRKDVDILAYRYSRKSLETVIHQFLEAQALDPNIPLVPRQEEDIGRRCNV
ncbi:acyl transferase/acyl hydrolase/lysophospholipase [Pyronema omphalodes]|nr:acyl transferase/acyl hydrolase/lysophospholipase [Pyronema omphalodes]